MTCKALCSLLQTHLSHDYVALKLVKIFSLGVGPSVPSDVQKRSHGETNPAQANLPETVLDLNCEALW